jgi:ABC-2 type transport system permease protein
MEAAAGPFGALARAQYRALAEMRWRLFRNSLRTTNGAAELGATVVANVMYSLLGLGLAAGMGGGAYAVAANGKWIVMAALFWAVLLMWQIVPVSIASFQEQFDPGGLLRFPVSFGTFFVLHMIFGLVDVSSILGGFCCVGIWVGVTIARPDLAGWMALALAVFAAFNVLLVRAVFAWIDRWMAQRRTREIVSAVFVMLALSAQLLNPAFHMQKGGKFSKQQVEQGKRWLNEAIRVQSWLPPGVAWQVVESAGEHRPAQGLEALAGLGIYVCGAGGVLAVRLRAGYRGENLNDAPARTKTERRGKELSLGGAGPVAAVMEKELRALTRSLPLLYGVAAPLIMVFFLSGLFVRRSAGGGGTAPAMALMISLGYAIVGFTQLFYNILGPEGSGVQLLFLSPTPLRKVILGKNLFHALLFAIDAVLVCILGSLRLGAPRADALAATVAWVMFALPVHLAAGNVFSLTMPYRTNLGRLARQRGSQMNALLSMGVQAGVLGIGIGIFALCLFLSRLWVAIPVFLVLAAGAWWAWRRVLGKVDAMAERRKELLIATLVKAE